MTETTILDERAVSEIEARGHAKTAKRQAGNFDNYERKGSGWICKTCGSTIMASIKYAPIWDGPFPCSGSGEVESYQLPYCPKCEVKP